MKPYAQEATAVAIAKKLTSKTGVQHSVTQAHGKWVVVKEGEQAEQAASTALVPVDQETGQSLAPAEQVASTSTPEFTEGNAPTKKQPGKKDLGPVVTIDVGGAWESKGYVYTPKIGKTTRWFMTKSLVGYETIHDASGKVIGGRISLHERALKTRGIVLAEVGDAAKKVEQGVPEAA